MCVNYKTSSREVIAQQLGATFPSDAEWKDEVWQDYGAPIVRSLDGKTREGVVASYGIIPKSHMPPGVKRFSTMNARAETIGEKRSYSSAWRKGQTCLIPTARFYEPNYENGKAERWAISMADDAPFCIAGLWRTWSEEEGRKSFSFTQITVNAEDHPLMKRFHKSDSEKRSLVIVPKDSYEDWLACRDPEIARSMLTLYPAKLMKAWAYSTY